MRIWGYPPYPGNKALLKGLLTTIVPNRAWFSGVFFCIVGELGCLDSHDTKVMEMFLHVTGVVEKSFTLYTLQD